MRKKIENSDTRLPNTFRQTEPDIRASVNVCVRSNRHSRSRARRKAETGGSGKISAGVHRSKCTPAFYIYFRIL